MTSATEHDELVREATENAQHWHSGNWMDFLSRNFKCFRCRNSLLNHAWFPYRTPGPLENADDYGMCPGLGMRGWLKTVFCPRPEQAKSMGQLLQFYSLSRAGQKHRLTGYECENNDRMSVRGDLLYDLMTRPAKYQIPMDSSTGTCSDYD